MTAQIQQIEQQLSHLKRDHIQLEQSSRLEKKTQEVQVWSPQDVQKLQNDVNTLQHKNARLRQVLENLGFRTSNVTTGKIETQEIRDVEHFKHTIREPIKESRVNESRVLGRTQRRTDTPVEVQEGIRRSQFGVTTTTTETRTQNRSPAPQTNTYSREVSKSPAPVRMTGNM